MKKIIACPICGNEVLAKATKKKQRCRWCGRFYKVEIWFRNFTLKNHIWEAKEVKEMANLDELTMMEEMGGF